MRDARGGAGSTGDLLHRGGEVHVGDGVVGASSSHQSLLLTRRRGGDYWQGQGQDRVIEGQPRRGQGWRWKQAHL
jgi:hypothetical protein